MMKCCEYCPAWAQYQMYWVERPDPKPEFTMIEGEKKQLVPKGPVFTLAASLCGFHQIELESQPTDLERKFVFVGAIALGSHAS